jgi:hypothetical protein
LVDVEPGRRGGHVHSVAPLLSEHRYAASDIAQESRRGAFPYNAISPVKVLPASH